MNIEEPVKRRRAGHCEERSSEAISQSDRRYGRLLII